MRRNRKVPYAVVAAVLLALILPVLAAVSVLAEQELPEDSAHGYVTVVGADGVPVLACREIPLRDTDGDGVLTLHDALVTAHELKFDGGAEAGYAFEETEDGRIATMLWGMSGDRIRIYVNHAPAEDLLAPIQNDDLLYGIVWEGEEDGLYCRFDVSVASVRAGKPLTLRLTGAGPDGEAPVADAVIRIDGKDSAFRTDADGNVTLQFDGSGSCVVSAWKDGEALCPPVCVVSVGAEEPYAGDRAALRWVLLSVAAMVGITLTLRRRRRTDLV